MKSFHQFIIEAYDKELEGQASRAPGEEGRIRASRKKRELDKKRVKVVGDGKTEPAKDYKTRKDAGTNKPRSRNQQQPEKERGTAALSAREAQRKAAKERRAAKSGAKTKTADELLSTKKKTVDPKYKPTGKQGHGGTSKKSYSAQERKALTKKGERRLRDLRLQATGKTKESELDHAVTQKEVTRRNKKK
tara:strand:- start:10 stop:582 length:573 start_codon:yes stop_codon:yes gene_type:complete